MPTYGYQCTACQHEFQVFQTITEAPLATCPQCNGPVKRLLYPVGIIFKGSGWYITDSRKQETKATSETEAGGESATKTDETNS